MYQSWWPKFRWIKPEIPLKPMGKSWCFFGRIPILWRIWTWKFTPNFKTNKPTKNKRFWGFKKKPNSLPNLEGLVSRVRSQLRSCWCCGRTCFPEPWPPEPTHGHCFLPFPQNGGFKKPPGMSKLSGCSNFTKSAGHMFFPSPLRRTRSRSWNVLVGCLSLKSSFSPQHGFLGNFFSRKDSKKPEFFGGFWRRKIPEKNHLSGVFTNWREVWSFF